MPKIDLRSRRKVIDVGGSAVITLPAVWTREHQVKVGDYLVLTVRGRSLQLQPLEGAEEQRAKKR